MRTMNFAPGPAALPLEVLERIRADLPEYRGEGRSVLELSHRGDAFRAIDQAATERLRRLLQVPDTHAVLWLQGGARAQFAWLPLNLLEPGRPAAYVVSGHWAARALAEARTVGEAVEAASSRDANFAHVPAPDTWTVPASASYLHLTTNNTIYGTQLRAWRRPAADVPVVCDASSDVLSRPVDWSHTDLLYAGAQKNLGPAGVTLVVIRRDLAERAPRPLPEALRYATWVRAGSAWNTPPVFAIYVVGLVLEWLEERGGLAAAERWAQRKAELVYGALDAHPDVYRPVARAQDRSPMNVTWRLADPSREAAFLHAAAARGIDGIRGHRSVGGFRASLYNAVPLEWAEALATFLDDFAR